MKHILILLITGLSICSCKKSSGGTGTPGTPSIPQASIADVKQGRGATTSTFSFTVSLNQAATKEVTIHYTTKDGDAKAGTDYAAASGMVTIAAGSSSASISVQVTGDSARKSNQAFQVILSSPVNCTINRGEATGEIVNENGTYLPVSNDGYTTPDHYTGYTLAWSDEFSGSSISTTNWDFENGNNNGWGNHELENYTDRINNAFVSQGKLIIEARQENFNGNNYTSARMITKGKQSFKFGRIDIRAKLPKGKGIWPALWMLGDNIDAAGWPACGEIDIMELLGHETNKMYGTLHWGATPAAHASKGSSYTLPTGGFDDKFHVFSMVWMQDTIKLLVDDQPYFTLNSIDVGGNYPFNDKFFFIFNIAVGGDWPGAPDANTTFPQRMFVDYVRVFQ